MIKVAELEQAKDVAIASGVSVTQPRPYLEPSGVQEGLELLPDAVVIGHTVRDRHDNPVDIRVVYVNRQARTVLPDTVRCLGRRCSELWPEMVLSGSFDACLRVAATGEPEHGSFQYDGFEGLLVGYDWRAVRLSHDSVMWIQHDDSDRLQALANARRSEDAARQANSAKTDFLSRMSHELRTPLNSIIGFAQLLELDDDLTADQSEAVSTIRHAGGHLLDLINEVLDVARMESGRLDINVESIDVDNLLRTAQDLVAPLAQQRGVRLHPPGPADSPTLVLADRQRLLQVLLNLLSNAIKYNRDRGEVFPSWESSAGTVAISIRDTGKGIPRHQRDRLFEPFDRLGAEATPIEGTGIGLTLSRGLVEQMGGILYADSEVGIGSTFTIELPAAPDDDEGDLTMVGFEERLPSSGHPCTTGFTILSIEDNSANQQLLDRALRRRPDIEVLHSIHGGLGIELARQQRPNLILLDLHLPDMEGREVLHDLVSQGCTGQIPVVIVSADTSPGIAEELRGLGAAAYLSKPIDVSELLDLVDHLHEPKACA